MPTRGLLGWSSRQANGRRTGIRSRLRYPRIMRRAAAQENGGGASNFLRDDETGPILPREHRVRFLVANALQRLRVEVERAAQPVGNVGEMHQLRREIALLDVGVQVGPLAAAHGLDEVRPVAAAFRAGRSRFLLFA